MTNSLHLLLNRSLDYAGMFPPAALATEPAVRYFLREREASEGWLLSRFVCPAAKLGELAAASEELGAEPRPLILAALGRGGKTAAEFLAGLESDLSAIVSFRTRIQSSAKIDVIEARLPADALDAMGFKKLLTSTEALLARVPDNGLQLFLEIPPSPLLPGLFTLLAEHNRSLPARHARPIGYKLRTGGVDSAAFPTCAQVAAALAAARDAGLVMKCTGGLHHAVRRSNSSTPVKMHGFINVLAAAALGHARGADATTLEALLAEEDPQSFVFREESLAWRDQNLTGAQLAAARQALLISFGSCYFDEPRADLRALGWW
jgi:hypothetical protein